MTLGPGAYAHDPNSKKIEQKYHPPKASRKDTNWASLERFRNLQSQTSKEIGPGSYKVGQKWNKRTYNLKFLENKEANGKQQRHSSMH